MLYIYNDNAACADYRILQYIIYTPEYLYWFLNKSIGHCLLKGKEIVANKQTNLSD